MSKQTSAAATPATHADRKMLCRVLYSRIALLISGMVVE